MACNKTDQHTKKELHRVSHRHLKIVNLHQNFSRFLCSYYHSCSLLNTSIARYPKATLNANRRMIKARRENPPNLGRIRPVCSNLGNKDFDQIGFPFKTSQELRMLSSVTLDCQVTKIVMNSGSQL